MHKWAMIGCINLQWAVIGCIHLQWAVIGFCYTAQRRGWVLHLPVGDSRGVILNQAEAMLAL